MGRGLGEHGRPQRSQPGLLFESILKADAEKGQTQFRVLDVGAGPLSMMGYALPSMPGARLELVPTDPLGDTYAKALLKAGVIPLVAVRTIMAEDLSKVFSECSQENDNWARCFDLLTSRNALDHAKDPVECIRQMVRVTKPGHTIMQDHRQYERGRERNVRRIPPMELRQRRGPLHRLVATHER